MMVRKFMAASAALVLAGVMSASTVSAKPCPKLCHAQIKACYATNCTTKPKGACKKSTPLARVLLQRARGRAGDVAELDRARALTGRSARRERRAPC